MATGKQPVEKIQVIPVGKGRWAVPSTSHPGVSYEVVEQDGTLVCNCMAGLSGKFCKHKKAVSIVAEKNGQTEERRLTGEKMVEKQDEKASRTKMGYAFDEVASALQKEIRRGRVEEAVYWGLELYEVAQYYCWKRLEVIAAEDIGLADVETVRTVSLLHQGWELAKKTSWYVSPHQLTLAIILLCRAPKSTEVEDMQSYFMERKRQGWKIEMPDYAVDGHTKRGKAMGRGGENWADWYEFRHKTAGIPENDYTRKLKEIRPDWFRKPML